MASPFLSVSEVSQLLRVSQKWVYQTLGKGELPGAFRIRGVWFVDREMLLNALKERALKPKPRRLETAGSKNRHDL
jgi:hypothetical protein